MKAMTDHSDQGEEEATWTQKQDPPTTGWISMSRVYAPSPPDVGQPSGSHPERPRRSDDPYEPQPDEAGNKAGVLRRIIAKLFGTK
jgi:hypothetical protein